MKLSRLLFLIMCLIVFIIPVAANGRGGTTFNEGDPVVSTEPQPDPIMVNGEEFINDPRVNSDANACHEGGSLAGLCDTTDVDGDGDVDDDDRAFMWAAGWHLIQYEYSMVTRDQVAFFANMLPPEIIFIPSGSSSSSNGDNNASNCTHRGDNGTYYILSGTTLSSYSDSSCSNVEQNLGRYWYSGECPAGFLNLDNIPASPEKLFECDNF